jgi:phytol kinase
MVEEVFALGELWGTLVVAAATTLVIVAIEVAWRVAGIPLGLPHEVARKAHHVGIGLIATFMPLAIASRWIGFVLALGFGTVLLTAYRLRLLKSLYREAPAAPTDPIVRSFRHAWIGPATFSMAVALVSAFFWGSPDVYRASLLILTLGDSAATMVGALAGRRYYLIFGTRRSVAGNTALLALASLVCAATLAGAGTHGAPPAEPATLVAIALLFGFLLCLTETISPLGLDNLTLPLMTAVVMLSLSDASTGGYALGPDTLTAFLLVGLTALLFTLAHLHPALLDAAALALGASIVVLLEMGRDLFVGILLVFMACTLVANALALRQGLARGRVGLSILAQVAPCIMFMLAGRLVAASGMAVGSVACVILLGGRWWASVSARGGGGRSAGGTAPATPGSLALQAAVSFCAAWGAILVASAAGFFWSLSPHGATLVAVTIAATAGGFASWLVLAPEPAAQGPPAPLAAQVVPGMVAVSAIPVGVLVG